MNAGKICVSICGETAHEVLGRIERAGQLADVIEIRFDCLRPEETGRLIGHLKILGKEILATLRPLGQGGTRQLTMQERVEFWQSTLPRLDGVNFLIDREFDLNLPFEPDPNRTIVSSHNFDGREWKLPTNGLSGANILKLAITVEDAVDAISLWQLLSGGTAYEVIPIAMGEAGKWTRILGLAHAAPMTYASLDRGDETAPGQISARELRDVFRVKELDKETGVYGIIAGNTSYSMSPYMHNAAFKHDGVNSVFIPMQVRDLDTFMRRMVTPGTREVELNLKGFSVTNPHKQAIMKHLDSVDETAQKIGEVNTVKIEDGKLYGYNTDAPGFIAPLKNIFGELTDARVTVAGIGGAARACVYALKQEGAEVTILARDTTRAAVFAEEFAIKSATLTTGRGLPRTDILVNATPIGTIGGSEGEAVATADELSGAKLVYDLVYNPEETELLRRAKIAGAKTLGGMEMLVAQGAQQFLIWTGGEAPIDEMKAALNRRLKETYAG
jgi:3-dehydroquinate dehydratase/shikimate dehydrogenase